MSLQFRLMTKTQTVYSDETRLNHFMRWLEYDVEHKIGVCWLCNTKDIVQHQDTCLNCMMDYSKACDEIKKELTNCCSICGHKRKLILDSNCCNSCLMSSV